MGIGEPPEEPTGGDDGRTPLVSGAFALLLFALGLGAGLLVALAGEGVVFANLGAAVAVLLGAFFAVALVGLLLLLFRRPLVRWLFRVTGTELRRIAEPLAELADRAARGEAQGAAAAAGRLARHALARYAMLTGRRWIVATLTGLLAALAALVGTTLLYRQNQLISDQTRLLAEQNARVAEQTLLLGDQNAKLDQQTALLIATIELTEAQRSAELLVLIAEIASDLTAAVELARDAGRTEPFDLEADFEPGLVARMVLATQSARAYRYLDTARAPADQREALRSATRLRPDLGRSGGAG